MKTTIRTITAMILVTMLLCVAALPALAAGYDFETAISEFAPTSFNTFTLETGTAHTPQAALWAQQGIASCYSSDEAIVTVATNGTVTAVGEGTAYVAVDAGGMSEVYRYDVVAVGTGSATQSDFEAYKNQVMEAFQNEKEQKKEEYNTAVNSMWEQFEEAKKQNEEMFAQAKQQNEEMFAQAQKQNEEIFAQAQKQNAERLNRAGKSVFNMATVAVILAVTFVLLMIAEIIYILIAAPKCGMSRLWALMPLFSNILGLIVFIIVRSGRNTVSASNTVICPTCGSVHPTGTAVCAICGTKLQ